MKLLSLLADKIGISRNELLAILLILVFIWTAAYFNLQKSLVLARDVQRKNDLKHVAAALTDYTNKAGSYPKARDGKIVSCGQGLGEICRWNEDPLLASGSAIMSRLPADPLWYQGLEYLYRSNTRDFQLYTHLEDGQDSEFNAEVAKKDFLCGNKTCNFGLTSNKEIPLTEDINLYEDED